MKSSLPALLVLIAVLESGPAFCDPPAPQSPAEPVKTTLIYQIEPPTPDWTPRDVAEKVVAVLQRRINPGWWPRASIRRLDDNRIEIVVRGNDAEKIRRIRSLAESVGTLEFRILANRHDHASLIEKALADPKGKAVKDAGGELLAWWVPVSPQEARSLAADKQIATRPIEKGGQEALVVSDPYHVTGAYLKSAVAGADPAGKPCVLFQFNAKGGELFGRLTGENLPQEGFARRLGIILDGRLYSALAVRSRIYDRGQITGNFTRQEVEDLVTVFNAGSLPAKIKLAEQRGGTDNQQPKKDAARAE
jgi:SecD/SecF fusion protein